MTLIVFWFCVGLIAYTYAGFPVLLAIRALLFKRPFCAADITPRVSLVIAAHNEAASIGSKLENALTLDYPRPQFEVIVASDGSTDGTDDIVRCFSDRGVKLLSLPRGGKAAALNGAVAVTTGDVLVFSDANSIFDTDAIRALVRPLGDPEVGGVAGDQRYLPAAEHRGCHDGERRYWDLDRRLKRWQSQAGNVTSATGAIYAIRHALFTTVPEGVTDDFAVSTAVIAQGYRLVFASDAVAYEPTTEFTEAEFARKIRIITRGLRGILERPALFNPLRYGFYSLQLFSHKVLRRLMAFPLLTLVAVSPWLWAAGTLYRAVVLAQFVVYACAALGWLLETTRAGRFKLFSLPLFFVLVNAASFVAVGNVLRGRRIVIWQTKRSLTAAPEVAAPHLG